YATIEMVSSGAKRPARMLMFKLFHARSILVEAIISIAQINQYCQSIKRLASVACKIGGRLQLIAWEAVRK
ncbi:MAG: hypothetical protein V3U88_00955, partial [Methylococcales bacterium]